ncbi:TPA: hypothetical protein ACH3X2_001593 [Trebouxia sp. C0005]
MAAVTAGGCQVRSFSSVQACHDFLLDLSEDVTMPDLLSLRHDQQLEHAKEYNSILAEPLGSRLRARGKSAKAAQGSSGNSVRPAWVQPCKCAPHPWRPLQWDHVNQLQLQAFESGLRGAGGAPEVSDRRVPEQCSRLTWQDQQPQTAQMNKSEGEAAQQPTAKSQPKPMPHAVAPVARHSRQRHHMQREPISHEQRRSADVHVQSVSQPGKSAACLHGPLASQGGATWVQRPSGQASCQHTSVVFASPGPMSVSCTPGRTPARQQSTEGKRSAGKVRAGNSCHGNSQARKQLSRCRDSPAKAGNAEKRQARGHTNGMAPHDGLCSGTQHVSRVQSSGKADEPKRSASASPMVMKNWIRWEASENEDEAESGLYARNRQLTTSPAAPSRPIRVTAQGRTRQHAAIPSPAIDFQQPPNKKQTMLPDSGHSPHAVPASEACLPSERKPLQSMQQPPPAHQSNGVRITEQAELDTSHADAGMARRSPDMRYCLSSSQPALGAGLWEEQTTRSWLREAGLAVLPPDERATLMDNPLRNGLLLCDLAGALEGRFVWGVNRKPRTLSSARGNIMAALGHLGMLTAQTCPTGMLHEVEHVLQGRQASIWGLLNHLRLTHPSSPLLSRQLIGQQAVDRTLTSSAEACKPDRCSGAVAAATNVAHDVISAHMVSLGPHGSVRCTSPVHRSPEAKQHKKRQLGSAPCPYHDRETITVSLVQESGLYTPPERSVSPQRSQRGHSPAKQRGDSACSGGSSDSYIRVVAVGPAVAKHQHRSGQCCDKQDARQQHAATPQRSPEPAAAAAQGSRKAALTQLRTARRRQQQQLTPADVEQEVGERMCGRNKQGAGAHWSSRKAQKEQQMALSDQELVAWVRGKGLTEVSPGMLLEESFADGRLLCRLVSLLERRSLSGVEWRAPSLAASRHNIAKAMSELKKRPSMSLQNLWQVTEVVKAEPGFVQALLNDIVTAYK